MGEIGIGTTDLSIVGGQPEQTDDCECEECEEKEE